MNETMTNIQKRFTVLMIAVALLSTIGLNMTNMETVTAQTNNSSSQNQTDEFKDLITGPNQQTTNDTLPLGTSLGDTIREDVTISLANASMIAEREVGQNAHAEEARIGIWNDGTMVYFTLVLDSSDHLHGVVVNAENGTVIESNKITGANSFFMLLL
jgi:uncharacterized membrane protein YkoI